MLIQWTEIEVGELEYENFNAAGAVVKINGLSVHPGYAFGQMKMQDFLQWNLHKCYQLMKHQLQKRFEGFII